MAAPLKPANNANSQSAGFEQFLVDNGFLKPQVATQIRALQQQNGQDFGQLLIAEKVLDEEDLAKAKAAFFNLPYVDLRQLQVPQSVLSFNPAGVGRIFIILCPLS